MKAIPMLFLIEDEAELQEELFSILIDAGFDMVIASNGKQALEKLASDAAQFKVTITDIRMGNGPDGWEVGRRARETVPDMPVIYMSGDSGADWSSKGVPNCVMLTKPFASVQLITAVSLLLNDACTHKSSNPN